MEKIKNVTTLEVDEAMNLLRLVAPLYKCAEMASGEPCVKETLHIANEYLNTAMLSVKFLYHSAEVVKEAAD